MTPELVAGLPGATKLAAGDAHACAVTAGGSVMCWGANDSGQLGDQTNDDRGVSLAVQGLSPMVHLAAGATHTCAVGAAGPVRCWGGNSKGQLGDGFTTPQFGPVAVVELVTAGGAPELIGVRSRKTHGPAGEFDLAVDTTQSITGNVTVDPRVIGSGHRVVFIFDAPITSFGSVSAVDSAQLPFGSVSAIFGGSAIMVTITGAPDNRRVMVSVNNVNGLGQNVSAALGFLVGDVDNSRSTTSADILGIKGRAGQATDYTNLKYDINLSGGVTAADILLAKGRSGLVLPIGPTPTPPVLSSISPATLPADGLPHAITLTGSNFGSGATVLFNAVAVTPSAVTAAQITVTAPASMFSSAGTVGIRVRNPDAMESGLVNLAVTALPTLSAVSPATVEIDGNTRLFTLTGTAIQSGAVVVVNGSQTLNPASVTATQVQVSVPGSLLNATGTLSLAVRNPDGGTSGTQTVMLTAPNAPFLYSLAPSTIMAGSPALQVTLTGASFQSGATVRAGTTGQTTLNATFVSGQQMTVTIPANLIAQAGELPLRVVNPGTITESARTSNVVTLLVTPAVPLQVSAIAPTSGQAGDTVLVAGQGFSTSNTGNQVTFASSAGRAAANVVSVSSSQLSVIVPAGTVTGVVQVTVNGTTATGPTFTIAAPNEQEFGLIAGPAVVKLVPGGDGTIQVQLGSGQSFTGLVELAVTGLPSGVTAKFDPPFVALDRPSSLVLTAATTAPAGSYPIQVTGINRSTTGAAPKNASATIEVQPPGQTGITGRFITPDGRGIANVRVRVDDKQVVTDAAGNFVLTGLTAGDVNLRLDATGANPLYPIWPYAMKVIANKITPIPPWTLTPPPTEEKFTTIASGGNQTITDERYPGVEIKIPAGVTITGWDGVPKSRIAIEKLDADKLPVTGPPIPTRSAYQLHFGTPMGGIPSAPIPVTLPNDLGLEPGQKTELWFYDGSPMGGTGEWKQAGTGTVSADGKTIVSDPGSGIPRFCGVCGLLCFKGPDTDSSPKVNAKPGSAVDPNQSFRRARDFGRVNPDLVPTPEEPCQSGCSTEKGNPVDIATGLPNISRVDQSLAGFPSISLASVFNSVDAYDNVAGTATSLGLGWTLEQDVGLLPFTGPLKQLILPGNIRVNFTQHADGKFRAGDTPALAGAELTSPNPTTWELRFKTGGLWRFNPFAGQLGANRGQAFFLTAQVDNDGNTIEISRRSDGRILSMGTAHRAFQMTYGANGFISEVRDPVGRLTRYTYSPDLRVTSVISADGKGTSYTYVGDEEIAATAACPNIAGGKRIKTISYPSGAVSENYYGPSRRVLRQRVGDGREYFFTYHIVGACVTHVSTPNVRCSGPDCPTADSWAAFQAGWRISGGKIAATTTTDSKGRGTSTRFDSQGNIVEGVDAFGQVTTFVRDPSTRQVTRVTDPLGRIWRYQYDARGNVIRSVDPANRLEDTVFDPVWNQPISVTVYDAAGTARTTQFQLSPQTGRLIGITDPLGNKTSYSYTPKGQIETVTNPLGDKTLFEYNAAGDLIKETDPRLHTKVFERDSAGRLLKVTSPLGYSTQIAYDVLGNVAQVTDAIGGVTRYTYDEKRNLESWVNPLGNPIARYEYDVMQRVSRIVDAAGNGAVFSRDDRGLISELQDRQLGRHTFSYDSAARIVEATFPAGARRKFSYDAVGRLVNVLEGTSSVSMSYDILDRVTSVTSSTAGTASRLDFEYDAQGRLVKKTVSGTDAFTYAYDAASRLTQVAFRDAITRYEWNQASRLTKRALPNGIVELRGYDKAGHVVRLAYENAPGQVREEIAYEYDADGRRSKRTSTMSALSRSETPFNATYDLSNRMTQISFPLGTAGTGQSEAFTFSYDKNGNLVSKTGVAGTTTFSWDDRNRLSALQSPGASASFEYDAFDRRTKRTVNGVSTAFSYAGPRVVTQTSTQTKILQSELGVDENIAMFSGQTPETYIRDALGSVLAVTDMDQSTLRSYRYSPYGETTPSSADPLGYAGRENDGTGLMFYRTRYYDPTLKRFLSEDPIGLAGGANVYAYARGNPISNTDPFGLDVTVCYYADAAMGFGHVGFSTPGDVGTQGFYPTGNALNSPGDVKTDTQQEQQCKTIDATPQQDQCMRSCRARRDTTPGQYKLMSRQCTSFVRDCLQECGLPSGDYNGPRPHPFYESLPNKQ